MLKDRVVTAAILIPFLITAVLLLSTQVLSYLFGCFVLIGAWEWSRLSGFTSVISRWAYVAVALFFMLSTHEWIAQLRILQDILSIVFVGWLFAFVWLVITPADKILSNAVNVYLRGVVGLALLIPTWLALLALHASGPQGSYLLLSLFVLIAVADSGAYFTGKLMGITRLAPQISPGKSVEGVYGGLITGAIVASLMGLLFGYSGSNLLSYVSVALFCIVFSIVGDLFESVAKRSAGVKDSGAILPGHGGVMDRIDSLTAAGPLYFLGLSWFPNLLEL
jgi:phosphatidate cytidylyltransferase